MMAKSDAKMTVAVILLRPEALATIWEFASSDPEYRSKWQTTFSFAIVNHTHAEPSNTFHESLTAQFGISPFKGRNSTAWNRDCCRAAELKQGFKASCQHDA